MSSINKKRKRLSLGVLVYSTNELVNIAAKRLVVAVSYSTDSLCNNVTGDFILGVRTDLKQ